VRGEYDCTTAELTDGRSAPVAAAPTTATTSFTAFIGRLNLPATLLFLPAPADELRNPERLAAAVEMSAAATIGD